jgi:hypothetical protein
MLSKLENINESNINEVIVDPQVFECQIGDTVRIDGEKGFVIGEIDGDLIVQIQGHSVLVDPKKVKEDKEKKKLTVDPKIPTQDAEHNKVSQKLLFEQFVKCGIYYGNVPIKLNDCFVKFSDWNNSTDEQMINVLIEEQINIMSKKQIRILEDINTFANPDNYVKGAIIDEETEDIIEQVMINASDYVSAIGDADPVRIVRQTNNPEDIDNQKTETVSKAVLRTLAV